MHIGIVGGLDRTLRHYEQVAEAKGHRVEIHYGHMAGRGRDTLETLVSRSDLVLVVTDVNSHGAVIHARKAARNAGRRCVVVRRLGLRRFDSLLSELNGSGGDLSEGEEGEGGCRCAFGLTAETGGVIERSSHLDDDVGLQSHAFRVRFSAGAPARSAECTRY